MKKRSKFLFKNMGILTISNFASKLLVFLLVPLYTSVLTTDEYGTYDLIVSTVSLLFPIFTANIIEAVMRFLIEKNCDKNAIAVIGVRFLCFGILAIIAFLFVINRLEVWPEIRGLEVYIALYYMFYALNQFFIQYAKGLERVLDMGVAGVLSTVITIGGNVFFLLIFNWRLKGFLLSHILAQAIPVVYYFCRLKFWTYIQKKNGNRKLQKKMLVYCVPLIATTLGWWVNSTSDKYVVTFMCGVAANGILAVSYKIPQILNTLQSIFIQAWQISAIKEYGEAGTDEFYGEIFSFVILLMSAACSLLIALSKPLASLLYAKDFFVAWQYVPFLLISSVINCASGLLGPILSAKKDSRTMAMAAIYGAGANIIMNVVSVWLIGIQGTTIATAISSFIIYAVRKRSVETSIRVTDYNLIFTTWVMLCGQALLEIYTPFWGIEILLMLAMLIINRRRLINVVNMMIKNFERK